MSKVLLKEIIPRFGLPRHLQSNNAPLFVVKVTQQFLQLLPPPFILETSVLRKNGMDQANRLYPGNLSPQEKWTRLIDYTLKKTLYKLCSEMLESWYCLLPIALLRVREVPKTMTKLSPF